MTENSPNRYDLQNRFVKKVTNNFDVKMLNSSNRWDLQNKFVKNKMTVCCCNDFKDFDEFLNFGKIMSRICLPISITEIC